MWRWLVLALLSSFSCSGTVECPRVVAGSSPATAWETHLVLGGQTPNYYLTALRGLLRERQEGALGDARWRERVLRGMSGAWSHEARMTLIQNPALYSAFYDR